MRSNREITRPVRYSEQENDEVEKRMPPGMSYSEWVRELTLGRPRTRISQAALVGSENTRILMWIANCLDRIAEAIASGTEAARSEWLPLLREIRDAVVRLAQRDKSGTGEEPAKDDPKPDSAAISPEANGATEGQISNNSEDK